MNAPFQPWADTLFRVLLFCLAAGVVGFLAFLLLYVRSPLFTNQRNPLEQPVQFDHRHHVADDRIDCRYCHNTVEVSPTAGYPASELCMGCHAQIWSKSPLLDPVRRSVFTDRPLVWQRVHWLPDFVYFNHAIHVNKGVGCVTCHGRVDQMAATEKMLPITMAWCLECHRAPEPFLRPREQITSMTWQPDGDPWAQGAELRRRYDVQPRTSCTTCHR